MARTPPRSQVIPKVSTNLSQLRTAKDSDAALIGHMMLVAGRVGAKECPNGFRVVVNDGKEGSQSVYHLHLHVLGGRQMKWPPG